MITRSFAITLYRNKRERLALDDVALHAGMHPALIERLVECGLVTPIEQDGGQLFFDPAAVSRLRTISRLREALGVNLADNGQGFEPQYASSIFEPFKRLHGLKVPDYWGDDSRDRSCELQHQIHVITHLSSGKPQTSSSGFVAFFGTTDTFYSARNAPTGSTFAAFLAGR